MYLCRVGLLCLGLLPLPAVGMEPSEVPSRIRFQDVTSVSGIGDFRLVCGLPEKDYIIESMSGGAAFLDFDNDGWFDIYLVNGSTMEDLRAGRPGQPNRLYRNRGDGTFADVTSVSGAGDTGWGMGVAAVDVNGDGWTDIYVTNIGPNVLLLNQKDGTFRKVDLGLANEGFSAGAAFADPDRDGDLDLFVTNYIVFDIHDLPPPPGDNFLCKFRGLNVYCGPRGLPGGTNFFYRQGSDGSFVDATREAGLSTEPMYGLGAVWGDFNNDGWTDLYVANDSQVNLLFLNQQDGSFIEDGLLAGVAVSGLGGSQAGMGVDTGDFNNDGWLDLYVTNFSHDRNTLYVNGTSGLFLDNTEGLNLAEVTYSLLGWGTGFVDFDNDRWLDIFVANSHVYPQMDERDTATRYRQSPICFINEGGEKFRLLEGSDALVEDRISRGVAFSDYDNDGDMDVLINNMEGPPTLLQNSTRNGNHWVSILLRGGGKNPNAIGARVVLQAGGTRMIREVKGGHSYLSQSDLRLHFGLGESEQIEAMEVHWPDGTLERVTGLVSNQFWLVEQGTGVAKLQR